jgi:hypothetical protein
MKKLGTHLVMRLPDNRAGLLRMYLVKPEYLTLIDNYGHYMALASTWQCI